MDMYQNFAAFYETIFPTEEKTVRTLASVFRKKLRLLDVGCGTGGYARALGTRGFTVVGIDSDGEMIAVANRLNRTETVTFWPESLQRFDETEAFDGAYCIGNVLPHLDTLQSVLEGLKRIAKALRPGSKLVIQILNYDRIVDQHVTSLPTITSKDGVEFHRSYRFEGDRIRFKTALKTPEKTMEGAVMLTPIRSGQLVAFLEEAGFSKIVLQEGFGGKVFSKDSSFSLVATAIKA